MAWSPSEEWSARSQIWKFPLPENAKKEFGLGDIAWWAQGGACSAVQGGMQLHGRVRKWGRTWTGSSKSRERLLAGPGRVTLKERWGRRGVHRRWWWKAFIEDGKTGRDLRVSDREQRGQRAGTETTGGDRFGFQKQMDHEHHRKLEPGRPPRGWPV